MEVFRGYLHYLKLVKRFCRYVTWF